MAAIVGVHISGELPGAVKDYGSGTLPFGFLICDGSAVSRITYARLFSYIGISYGPGDGSTTFNLPDLRGFFTRGWDNGAGHDPDSGTRYALNGGAVGDNIGSYQVDGMSDHNHYVVFRSGGGGTPPEAPGGGGTYIYATSSTYQVFGTNTVVTSETRPLNVYFNKMIAYV
jgi:microcystin-dependent protein